MIILMFSFRFMFTFMLFILPNLFDLDARYVYHMTFVSKLRACALGPVFKRMPGKCSIVESVWKAFKMVCMLDKTE